MCDQNTKHYFIFIKIIISELDIISKYVHCSTARADRGLDDRDAARLTAPYLFNFTRELCVCVCVSHTSHPHPCVLQVELIEHVISLSECVSIQYNIL